MDDTRIRGGVLLVIGEGMCLKAPKIQKHTERLKVPGWDFISKFAARARKRKRGREGIHVPSGRSHFQIHERHHRRPAGLWRPLEAGGFRLRYGRARPSGLAAASANPACMAAMDDFITVGTQMKIERPAKPAPSRHATKAKGPGSSCATVPSVALTI